MWFFLADGRAEGPNGGGGSDGMTARARRGFLRGPLRTGTMLTIEEWFRSIMRKWQEALQLENVPGPEVVCFGLLVQDVACADGFFQIPLRYVSVGSDALMMDVVWSSISFATLQHSQLVLRELQARGYILDRRQAGGPARVVGPVRVASITQDVYIDRKVSSIRCGNWVLKRVSFHSVKFGCLLVLN